jgi:hypothetical protein
MALIECPECKHAISDRALSCPSCGLPLSGLPSPSQPVAVQEFPPSVEAPSQLASEPQRDSPSEDGFVGCEPDGTVLPQTPRRGLPLWLRWILLLPVAAGAIVGLRIFAAVVTAFEPFGMFLSSGILIFFIVAIVKAFTRRTTVWIILGGIGGVIWGGLYLLFLWGFIQGYLGGH